MAVMNLANALQVHPAIVTGKVRYERQNYRFLSPHLSVRPDG